MCFPRRVPLEGAPGPFVAVTALPDSRQEAFETSVQPPSVEPVWNESHAFVLEGLATVSWATLTNNSFAQQRELASTTQRTLCA